MAREKGTKNGFWDYLAGLKTVRRNLPKSLKFFVRRFMPLDSYYRQVWRYDSQYAGVEETSSYPANVDVRLGIIKEFAHHHQHYIGACRELGVPYKLLDISGPNWIEEVANSHCDAFLVYPSSYITVWKQMFDERLKVMVEDMGKIIYPSYNELWFYESKRRMHYWLKANDIPQAQTWIFYNPDEAFDFARQCELPIIFKSDLGAGASGVKIFRRRTPLLRFLRHVFRKGLVREGGDPRDRQWGSIFLQEYLPEVREWRILRLGKSYFGHQKLKKGWSHSGSGRVGWYDPPKQLLDFVREVTDKGEFTSMDLDIFETKDGRYLVNELQSVFGSYLPYQMLIDSKPGRYIYEYSTGQWIFEEGVFCQNGSCNLRVEALLEKLGKPLRTQWWSKTK